MNGDPEEDKLEPPHKIIDDLFEMLNNAMNQIEYLRIRLSQPDYPDYPSHGDLAPPCQCCKPEVDKLARYIARTSKGEAPTAFSYGNEQKEQENRIIEEQS